MNWFVGQGENGSLANRSPGECSSFNLVGHEFLYVRNWCCTMSDALKNVFPAIIALVGTIIAVFVGYRQWKRQQDTTRTISERCALSPGHRVQLRFQLFAIRCSSLSDGSGDHDPAPRRCLDVFFNTLIYWGIFLAARAVYSGSANAAGICALKVAGPLQGRVERERPSGNFLASNKMVL